MIGNTDIASDSNSDAATANASKSFKTMLNLTLVIASFQGTTYTVCYHLFDLRGAWGECFGLVSILSVSSLMLYLPACTFLSQWTCRSTGKRARWSLRGLALIGLQMTLAGFQMWQISQLR